ncbi:MAG: HNH endonuclease [Clostridiales bacterium]|nr:HNH endonuclease [Clostridiales bacterium]
MYPDEHRYFLTAFNKSEVGVNSKRDDGRWVMACVLGRKLDSKEIVHHIDGNRKNNHPFNLLLTDKANHIRIHTPVKGYKFTEEQRKRLSDAHKGITLSEDTKRKLSKKRKGRPNPYKGQPRSVPITWGDKISFMKTKVFKCDLLEYIQSNPNCSVVDIMEHFNLKSKTPIYKYGTLPALKKEAEVLNNQT